MATKTIKKNTEAVKKTTKSTSLEATIYNQTGKKSGSINLPEIIFGLPKNNDLVHQVATALMANARPTVADTKGRGEVRGGGKKPWRQKGTGRARHGSSRSPIWRGGGVTHGPLSEKDYSQKINKKMRAKALFTVFSEKNRIGEMLFVDNISLSNIKTKDAMSVVSAFAGISGFEKLSHKRKNRGLFVLDSRNSVLEKSFANIPQVDCKQLKDINVLDVLNHKYVVVISPEKAFTFLESKLDTK